MCITRAHIRRQGDRLEVEFRMTTSLYKYVHANAESGRQASKLKCKCDCDQLEESFRLGRESECRIEKMGMVMILFSRTTAFYIPSGLARMLSSCLLVLHSLVPHSQKN